MLRRAPRPVLQGLLRLGIAFPEADHVPQSSCSRRSLHSSSFCSFPSTHATDVLPVFDAASPYEQLFMFFGPKQLAVQALEVVHVATGLPWWASLPVAALIARAALLPLTIKAKAASASIPLMHHAFMQARTIGLQLDAAIASAKRTSSASDAGSSGSSVDSNGTQHGAISRMQLTRHIFRTLRRRQGVPGFGWYLLDGSLQTSILVFTSLALRDMSAALWPGLVDEGLFYFRDLTVPAVYLQTLSTPLGTAGAVVPLAAFLMYITCVDNSAGARSANTYTALRLLAVPFYPLALLQPHAVLLFWISYMALQAGTQKALTAASASGWLRLPPILQDQAPPATSAATAAALASPATPSSHASQPQAPSATSAGTRDVSAPAGSQAPTAGADTAIARISGGLDVSSDPSFLVALAESLASGRGDTAGAWLACCCAALQLDPGYGPALAGAAQGHAARGEWLQAAELSMRYAAQTQEPVEHLGALLHATLSYLSAARDSASAAENVKGTANDTPHQLLLSALKTAQSAVAAAPDLPLVHYTLGWCHAALGNVDNALIAAIEGDAQKGAPATSEPVGSVSALFTGGILSRAAAAVYLVVNHELQARTAAASSNTVAAWDRRGHGAQANVQQVLPALLKEVARQQLAAGKGDAAEVLAKRVRTLRRRSSPSSAPLAKLLRGSSDV